MEAACDGRGSEFDLWQWREIILEVGSHQNRVLRWSWSTTTVGVGSMDLEAGCRGMATAMAEARVCGGENKQWGSSGLVFIGQRDPAGVEEGYNHDLQPNQ
jgi:hypothetical protein